MKKELIRKLEDGLILRHGTSADGEALAKFNRGIHGEDEWDGKGVAEWTLDLISGEAPTFAPGDFTIVEDTNTGAIVSSCCTISQTWTYAGIPFKVGRPELVGTLPDYRRRGLVRKQFEILHNWSAQRGELVQIITGIPYYYRQFGYTMALNLGGGRSGSEAHLPKLKKKETESTQFRLAEPGDIPFLMGTYQHGCQRSLVSAQWDRDLWSYELTGKRKYNINRRDIYIIESLTDEALGFIGVPPIKWREKSTLTLYELAPGVAWSAVTPSVIRFIWQRGKELAQEQNQAQTIFGFWLGEDHPAYTVAASQLPYEHTPYAYYLRVPDLAAFISLIKPVLEERLAESPFIGFTGEVKLNFYRDGLRLSFKDGKLQKVEQLGQDALEDATASFPPLVFIHLLFGYRNMEELHKALVDCYAKGQQSKHLLDALFPKKSSNVWDIS